MTASTLGAQAARGGMVTLLFQAAKVALMILSTVVLARLLSPEDYGLVAMVTAVIGVAEIFRDFGLSMAALQAKHLSHGQQSNLFWINTAVGVVLTLAACLGSGLIAQFYGEPRLQQIVIACSAVFVLGGLTTQFKVRINRELRFLALSWTDLAPYILAFAVAVGFAMAGAGYWALVAQQLTIAGGALVLSLIFARWWPGMPTRREQMRGLLNFGLSFATTQLLSYATRNVDSIAIGRVWGSAALGQYDRAFQLVMAPLSQINTPLSRVAIPVLSRLEDDVQFVGYLRKAQLVATYVTSTALFLLAGVGVPLVTVLMGPEWSFAGVLLSVLAIGAVFRSINQIAYWIYMSRGLAGHQLRFFAVAQPAVLLVMLAGLPWGALGVAIGNAFGFGIYWVASVLWAGRSARVDVRPLMTDALRILATMGLPVALLSAGCTLLLPTDWLRIVGGVAVTALWSVIAYLLIPAVRRDCTTLIAFARKATKRA